LSSIDWTRCHVDQVRCFAEGKCLNSLKDNPAQVSYYDLHRVIDISKLDQSNCSTGLQVIPFTTDKVLIYMQVSG
ncbi:hypothetical protein PFISCL1PPCAC_25955, partial [Pristionchus fissidentatus]